MKLLPALLVTLPFLAAAQNRPDDHRLGPLKELDGDFSWTPPTSVEAWKPRAEQVREQIRVALGLTPLPTRNPLHAVIHGRVEREDYTVEKVFFESMPGFFVTGSLYRPKGGSGSGKYPAVLCPHGHWNDARFSEKPEAELQKEIAAGGERSPINGRNMFQSLGTQLARMGCVAFVIDMLGYCDSQQFSYDLAHRFAKQRPEMISAEHGQWGLFTPQAETFSQSVMGLQTWNNMRALDFLSSLPDVDASRLACTGASGGGTQTMLLAALDPRLAVSFPCVMVSTAMQGGCTCENSSLLRIGTGNIEFAALFAPKPMAMTTAKDWTIDLPTKGFPQLEKHWALMGAPGKVQVFPHPEFGHNYNVVTREHIYAFFNEHLRLGLTPERLKEREYTPLKKEELTVWDGAHPLPPGGVEFEKELLAWWHDDAQAQREKDIPTFRKIAQPALEAIIGNTLAGAGQAEARKISKREYQQPPPKPPAPPYPPLPVTDFTIANTTYHEELPAVAVGLKGQGEPIALWLDAGGKDALLAEGRNPDIVRRLVGKGYAVVGIDGLLQGSFLAPGTSDNPAPISKNPRQAPCFTHGYNHSLTVQRVQDVLTVIRWAQSMEKKPSRIVLIGLDSVAAPVAAAAAAVSGKAVDALIVDTGGFRFQKVRDIHDPQFAPGFGMVSDLPGVLALGAPRKLFLMGEGNLPPDLTYAAYEVAAVPNTLQVSQTRDLDAALRWLSVVMK